jgi:hypothetical protein
MTRKKESALNDLIIKRAAERRAMDDPANYHPLTGSRHWRLNDAEMADALADAEITSEIACTDTCTLIAGYLGKSRGYKPFMCARTDGSSPHVMICPGMED